MAIKVKPSLGSDWIALVLDWCDLPTRCPSRPAASHCRSQDILAQSSIPCDRTSCRRREPILL